MQNDQSIMIIKQNHAIFLLYIIILCKMVPQEQMKKHTHTSFLPWIDLNFNKHSYQLSFMITAKWFMMSNFKTNSQTTFHSWTTFIYYFVSLFSYYYVIISYVYIYIQIHRRTKNHSVVQNPITSINKHHKFRRPAQLFSIYYGFSFVKYHTNKSNSNAFNQLKCGRTLVV